MLAIAGYAAAVLMGFMLGLVGGGGTILTVPILVYLLGIDPVRATGYSLFVVGATAAIGALRHRHGGLVDRQAVVLFGIPSILGVYLARALLMPAIPAEMLLPGGILVAKGVLVMVTFAIVMVVTAASMILSRRADRETTGPRATRPVALAVLEGLLVGAVTGFVGAGGGFLIVPALMFLMGLGVRPAIATSLVVIALKSLIGFVGEIQATSSIDWRLLTGFSVLAAFGIVGGVELNHRMSASRLRPLFGWFVLAMGIVILAREML